MVENKFLGTITFMCIYITATLLFIPPSTFIIFGAYAFAKMNGPIGTKLKLT